MFKTPLYTEEIKYSEKLSKLVYRLIFITIAVVVCWYIRSVLGYVILAALVTVLTNPLCNLICKIKIKGRYCPRWLGTILSMLAVFLIMVGAVTFMVPLTSSIARDISKASVSNIAQTVSVPLAQLNSWIVRTIPKVGADFKIENFVVMQLQDLLVTSDVGVVVGSVTKTVAKLGTGIFAVLFISFFFIKSPDLFPSLVTSLVPDKYDRRVRDSLKESGTLVSRYFIGMAVEVVGFAFLNTLGFLTVAKMGFKYSLGIGFMTGLMTIIPYIGPLIGGIIAVCMSLVIKFVCATPIGLDVGFMPFILILVAILMFTQLIDSYVFQPLIYSNSVKVHPLEIFIISLIAAQIGGMAGMFAAIPAYTVLRVMAKQFLGDVKVVKALTSINP